MFGRKQAENTSSPKQSLFIKELVSALEKGPVGWPDNPLEGTYRESYRNWDGTAETGKIDLKPEGLNSLPVMVRDIRVSVMWREPERVLFRIYINEQPYVYFDDTTLAPVVTAASQRARQLLVEEIARLDDKLRRADEKLLENLNPKSKSKQDNEL